MIKKKKLGQFFTKSLKIHKIVKSLIKNINGPVIEPSAGSGDLLYLIDKKRKIYPFEYDDSIKSDTLSKKYIYGCFFSNVDKIERPNTIISNPPYVNINEYLDYYSKDMKEFANTRFYKGRFNITYLFIHKCAEILVDDGEMIFIVPKDFTYATSARPLREYLKKYGSFSDWVDCGEEKLFNDSSLESLVIFRWVKNRKSELVNVINSDCKYERKIFYSGNNNTIFFLEEKNFITGRILGDLFNVLVGSVSGCDDVFKLSTQKILDLGIADAKVSIIKTFVNGPNCRGKYLDTNIFTNFEHIPQKVREYLLSNKEKLENRYSVRNNSNNYWWRWSFLRNYKYSFGIDRSPRIYVFSKTRKFPFEFGPDGLGYVGGTYAMFPRKKLDLKTITNILNSTSYRMIFHNSGLLVNNKFSTTPNAIINLPLTKDFGENSDL